MYVNLELDRASCLHRFKDVYNALGWEPNNVKGILISGTEASQYPWISLAPKAIQELQEELYSHHHRPNLQGITGDENRADQMANFCNQV